MEAKSVCGKNLFPSWTANIHQDMTWSSCVHESTLFMCIKTTLVWQLHRPDWAQRPPCDTLHTLLWREGGDWNLGNLSRESEYQAWGSRSAECYWTKIHLFVTRKRILVLHVFLCLFLDETFLVWISRLASPFIYMYIFFTMLKKPWL